MIVSLALIMTGRDIELSPRDEASRSWLLAGGEIFAVMPLARIRDAWTNRGVSRLDLPVIAAQLQQELNRERGGYERAGYGRDHVEFRVRACEYRNVSIEQELTEIS
jgi:hypothetical protein